MMLEGQVGVNWMFAARTAAYRVLIKRLMPTFMHFGNRVQVPARSSTFRSDPSSYERLATMSRSL